MSYRIKRRETPEQAAIRIAAEETGAALASLAEPQELGVAEAIHDFRKRCRKLRGLIRLVTPKRAKRARRLDRLYRDAAQELSGYRDAHATLATFDRLVAASEGGDGPTPEHFDPIRLELLRRSTEADEAVAGAAEPIERAVGLLTEAAERAEAWRAVDGWNALATGLVDTYRAGASTLDALRADPNAAAGHQLRKQAKYAWYHLRLLQRSAPSVLVPLAGAFESLVETLGDANDLDILSRAIAADLDAFGGADVALPVAAHLDEQHRLLRAAAVSRAVRLYAERPKAYAHRLGAYWDVWHTAGRERALGPIPPIEPSSGDDSIEPEPSNAAEPGSEPEPSFAAEPEPEPEPEPSSEPEPASDGLDELNVAGLRALAREHGLTGVSKLRRADLLAELRSSGVAAPEQV